ncbi:MAG: hypothetical protein ACFFE8_03215 [Candidatus Heimdallarchaeota archaeon]
MKIPTLIIVSLLGFSLTERIVTANIQELDAGQFNVQKRLPMSTNSVKDLIGNYSDHGEDIDGNGLFNFLVINIGIDITESREMFYLDITLRSVQVGILLGRTTYFRNMKMGHLDYSFNLDISIFHAYQLNYSFRIDYLEFGYVTDPGEGRVPTVQEYGPYTTRIYSYLEFDPPENPIMIIPDSPGETYTVTTIVVGPSPQGVFGIFEFALFSILATFPEEHFIISVTLIALILIGLGASVHYQKRG